MFIGIVLIGFLLDQFTKFLVGKGIAENATVSLFPGVFDLTFVKNTGAAFGIFAGKQMLLVYVTAGMIILICAYALIARKKISGLENAALALIVSGGLGNLFSRYFNGYVTDFLNCYFWPVFNIADILICVGCGLLIIAVLIVEPIRAKKRKNEDEKKAEKKAEAAAAASEDDK